MYCILNTYGTLFGLQKLYNLRFCPNISASDAHLIKCHPGNYAAVKNIEANFKSKKKKYIIPGKLEVKGEDVCIKKNIKSLTIVTLILWNNGLTKMIYLLYAIKLTV